MIKIVITAVAAYIGTIVSIYSLRIEAADNSTINFNDYRNKKILIVNTASGSARVNQLVALQQLYTQHHDSLVVIAFPSNSFGNEPKSNAEIKAFMQNSYGVTFPIAAKGNVTGMNLSPMYKWLGSRIQNDVTNGKTGTDFQKYLIDKNGLIVAVYDSSVSPMGTVLQEAINKY